MKQICMTIGFVSWILVSSCNNSKMLLKAPNNDVDPMLVELATLQSATLSTDQTGDPLESQQWNMDKVGASQIWHTNQGSRAVKVMLIGTGINYNHVDLRANVAVNLTEFNTKDPNTGKPNNGVDDDGNDLVDDFVGWDYVDNDGLAYDHYGFDTFSAGVIGAVHDNGVGIKGVAKQVSLYPVRYIDTNGMSRFPLLLQALQHVLQVKPHVVLLNVLNLKVGSADAVGEAEMGMLESILREIRQKGIPIVVGAGNVSLEVSSELKLLHTLAAYDNVFVVSSSTRDETKAPLANFSPRFVHTFAPGENVLSTAPDGTWDKARGTQLAAAHVAGALALAISKYGGSKTFRELFNALLSSEGSEEVRVYGAYSVGRNRLDVSKFLSVLR